MLSDFSFANSILLGFPLSNRPFLSQGTKPVKALLRLSCSFVASYWWLVPQQVLVTLSPEMALFVMVSLPPTSAAQTWVPQRSTGANTDPTERTATGSACGTKSGGDVTHSIALLLARCGGES